MIILPDEINFDSQKEVATAISELDLTAETQKEFSDGLSEIRRKAKQVDKRKECDELLERIKELPNLNHQIRYEYDFEDFTETEIPFRDIFFQKTQLERNQRLEVVAQQAADVGFGKTAFKQAYKAYLSNLRKINVQIEGVSSRNPTQFSGQPLELEGGEWRCDDSGVYRECANGQLNIACKHPILPVERFVNIDSGEEKIRIAYHNGGDYWRDIIISKREAFDASKVINLASYGVSVTSDTAKHLSNFLCDIEAINKDIIPEIESITRLGYIGKGDKFSPYVDDLVFDGDASYAAIFNAITEQGNYTDWLTEALKCRKESLTARIVLAASFASPLVSRIGALPFFVHLWGVESGTGKTVALMLAASVWGNPAVGQYVQTFNATAVGHEKTAAFLNNIPMCIDELQLSKDSHGKSKFDVYQLAQGVGRTRGNKSGGVDKTPTWALCILTTGESPLTNDSAGAGAVNRVIDIECKAAESVVKDGFRTSSTVKLNYGFAGRKFIEALKTEDIAKLTERYQELLKELTTGSTTEKQAMAAALVILADELAEKHIFKSGNTLTVPDISEFLKTKDSVSAGQRGYNYMLDWISSNSNKFICMKPDGTQDSPSGDIYGIIETDWVYVNGSVFKKAASDAGFDPRALLSWLKSNNLIETRGRAMTVCKRVRGIKTECVYMKLLDNSMDDMSDFVDIL